MEQKKFDGMEGLLSEVLGGGDMPEKSPEPSAGGGLRGIHVECNEEMAEALFAQFQHWIGGREAAYVLSTDQGYVRDRVGEYVNFFRRLSGDTASLREVLERFGLWELRRKRMRELKPGERMLVNLARISTRRVDAYFLQEPLRNLDTEGMRRALRWMEERMRQGAVLVTVHSSMKQALLLPGQYFYIEEGKLCLIQPQKELPPPAEGPLTIQKLAVRAGDATLLLEPKDIDYIESVNRANYLSVRGSQYPISRTMDELEEMLKGAGFFRCHRSYIVNVQRVERLERFTKNSFVLVLNNTEHSQIPLAKGRVEEMKQTFHW